MFTKSAWIAIAICMAAIVHSVRAQGQLAIVRITLGPDQIGTIKTAQGITTRVSFPDPVREIICGDLYDPGTGKGGFVVQRSDNDVFLKPIPTRGMTNLFVKTGEKGDHVYNFDLIIGSMPEAHRVVSVSLAQVSAPSSVQRQGERAALQPAVQQPDEALIRARQQAAETEKNAYKQAERIVAEAEQRAAETERSAQQHSDEIERRFVLAVIDGWRDIKISHPRSVSRNVVVTLDRKVIVFDGKSYLRYTIQNNGPIEFEFTSISLENGQEKDGKPIEANVIQDKAENKIAPKESLRGVIVFSPDLVKENAHLTMSVRGQDNEAIARAIIQ
jgi:hypothetical protein